MALIRRKKHQSREEKEDELLDLQLKQQKALLKQMESDKRKEKMQRFSSIAKRTGSFAARTITPKQEITREEANNRMFGFPSEMFDSSKAFGNSTTRGKKVYRRVR